jgi:hypothetical protein
MIAGLKIDPDTIYDDGTLVLALGVSSAALIRARSRGELRFRRIGQRPVYLGRWILDWLAQTPRESVPGEEVRHANA